MCFTEGTPWVLAWFVLVYSIICREYEPQYLQCDPFDFIAQQSPIDQSPTFVPEIHRKYGWYSPGGDSHTKNVVIFLKTDDFVTFW